METWKNFPAVLCVVVVMVTRAHSNPKLLNPEKVSDNLLEFVSLFSGVFSTAKENELQKIYQDEDNKIDYVYVINKPVYIPALQPALTVYFEEVTNGVVYRSQVFSFSEDEEGYIHIVPLDFTEDVSKIKPGTLDPDTLANLTLDDFIVPRKECNILFGRIDENVYMGSWPDCISIDKHGELPTYAMAITCNSFSVINSFPDSREKVSPAPYVHSQIGSFPLPDYILERADPNFQEPCQ